MTLTQTIKRREKRKRAKARAEQRRREWEAMSPARRKAIEHMRASMNEIAKSSLEQMRRNLEAIRFYRGDCWSDEPRTGVTIRVRTPERYRDDDPDLAERYR